MRPQSGKFFALEAASDSPGALSPTTHLASPDLQQEGCSLPASDSRKPRAKHRLLTFLANLLKSPAQAASSPPASLRTGCFLHWETPCSLCSSHLVLPEPLLCPSLPCLPLP